MVKRGWVGSIHGRRSSIEQASSFFEKVQLDFHLADLFEQFILLGVELLARTFAAVGEDVHQTQGGFALLKNPSKFNGLI